MVWLMRLGAGGSLENGNPGRGNHQPWDSPTGHRNGARDGGPQLASGEWGRHDRPQSC